MSELDLPRIDGVIADLKTKLLEDYAPPQVKRDAHPKLHGCVQAELIIGEVDERFRHGLFKHPGTYRTWVRFSNAFGIQHDLKADTRGLALKVLDPPGGESDFLDAEDGEHSSQDFLMATHDAFFLPRPEDYKEFAPAVKKGSIAVARYFLSRPSRWRGGLALYMSARVLARNPLAIPYFSQTPYQLGPHVVKLQATPTLTPELTRSLPPAGAYKTKALIVGMALSVSRLRVIKLIARLLGKDPSPANVTAFCDRVAFRDSLRHALMTFLSSHEAEFHLKVHCFVNEEITPIEDATRRWKNTASEIIPVATLRIPRQVFWPMPGMPTEVAQATSRMMDLGENMSFTPWHGLKVHKPLGAINLARKRIYLQIARFRRLQNGVEASEVLAQQGPKSYDALRAIVQGISVPATSSRFDSALSAYPAGTGFGSVPETQNP